MAVDRKTMLMVQKKSMPRFYYRVVRQIYIRKTWWSFSIKGSLSMMILIQHRRMSLDMVKILLAEVIGLERVLFAPINPAAFKIILLISDIIPMMPSFICHCFSFFDYVAR